MNPITILFVVAAASASAIPTLPVLSQYHAQDELGQYSYGYAGGPSSKHESRSIDGVTQGGFSYVDSNGLVQSRSYVSDPVNGFRVAASDVPEGHPEVAVAPVVAAAAPAPVISTYTAAAAPVVSTYSAAAPVVSTYSAAVPAVVLAATSTVVAAGTHTQYHSQDVLGQYRYGYSGGSSSKDELKTADGVTRGAFSYIDSHGLVQTRSYVADDVNGFRVAASDLPVAPAPVAPVSVSVAPVASVPVAPVSVPVAPVASYPVASAPVASYPFAPVASYPGAPVASVPVAPVDSGAVLQPAEAPSAPAAPAPAPIAEIPASDASSDSVVVDSA